MGNINARDPDYWNVPDDPGVRNVNWMAGLPSSTSIAQLSVPGTHDSMALHGNNLWATTQSLSLIIQLMVGIRFLDIRCRHFNDDLPIHHEQFYQNANFDDVLSTTINFLNSYPSETIFMRVKEEYRDHASGNTISFNQQVQISLDKYLGRFWTSNSVPTLGECRGKIVILDNVAGGAMGINWESIDLEDHWDNIGEDDKWNYVRTHLDSARSSTWSPQMFATFSSFTCIPEPPIQLARRMNPKLHSYARDNGGRLGIIASNFPGPKLIEDTIAHNYNQRK